MSIFNQEGELARFAASAADAQSERREKPGKGGKCIGVGSRGRRAHTSSDETGREGRCEGWFRRCGGRMRNVGGA